MRFVILLRNIRLLIWSTKSVLFITSINSGVPQNLLSYCPYISSTEFTLCYNHVKYLIHFIKRIIIGRISIRKLHEKCYVLRCSVTLKTFFLKLFNVYKYLLELLWHCFRSFQHNYATSHITELFIYIECSQTIPLGQT